MSGFLDRLRQKPAETRKRYAIGTSATVTGLIFVMWLTVVSHNFLGSDTQIQSSDNNEVSQTASPLAAFGDNAASAFRHIISEFSAELDEVATTTEQSTSTQQTSPDRSSDITDHLTTHYWATDTNQSDSVTEPKVQGDSDTPEETRNNKTPFTSRNYNPQQESDWFAN